MTGEIFTTRYTTKKVPVFKMTWMPYDIILPKSQYHMKIFEIIQLKKVASFSNDMLNVTMYLTQIAISYYCHVMCPNWPV